MTPNQRLLQMRPGDVIWIEVPGPFYAASMRAYNPAKSRRPTEMRDWVFSTSLYTAIHASNHTQIRRLVRVERTS